MSRPSGLLIFIAALLVWPWPRALGAANRIDELCGAKLAELGGSPVGTCSDPEFLRRAYLDCTGLLPRVDETRAFLADRDPQKRSKLIERLLASDGFADYWAQRWGDVLRLKAEYPVRVWPKGVQAYHRWLRQSIRENKPYDRFATELLTATGSGFRDGAANYYRALPSKDPQAIAETTALVFMGARLACARCHDHQASGWTTKDNLGLAAFFAQVKFKNTSEWKEEVVYTDPEAVFRDPSTKAVIKPQFLGSQPMDLAPGQDARAEFARWLTSKENPYFARNAVNRLWFWLLGRGIVQEVDDLRPGNPPTNPALLDYLAEELTDHGYDTRHVLRLILNSDTYQRSSRPGGSIAGERAPSSHYLARRLEAEQLLDAVNQVTESSDTYTSSIPEPYTRLPKDQLATRLTDGSITISFLELFGRPPRDTPYASERCAEPSMRQALHLLNSSDIERKVSQGGRLKRLLQEKRGDQQIIEEIYLSALSRTPTEAERTTLVAYVAARSKSRPQALQDVMWAVLNSKEFLFNH